MKNEIKELWIDLNEELYSFILSKMKDEQLAKDIHQDVFLKIQLNIHQLNDTSKLSSWVYQITRNLIIDHYRTTNLKMISINNLDLPENDDDNFNYSKLSRCINSKIKNLSKKHYEAIILTFFKGYSQKELSAFLKLSYSGTKSRVQKARAILKKNILDCPNIESDTNGKLLDFENELN